MRPVSNSTIGTFPVSNTCGNPLTRSTTNWVLYVKPLPKRTVHSRSFPLAATTLRFRISCPFKVCFNRHSLRLDMINSVLKAAYGILPLSITLGSPFTRSTTTLVLYTKPCPKRIEHSTSFPCATFILAFSQSCPFHFCWMLYCLGLCIARVDSKATIGIFPVIKICGNPLT